MIVICAWSYNDIHVDQNLLRMFHRNRHHFIYCLNVLVVIPGILFCAILCILSLFLLLICTFAFKTDGVGQKAFRWREHPHGGRCVRLLAGWKRGHWGGSQRIKGCWESLGVTTPVESRNHNRFWDWTLMDLNMSGLELMRASRVVEWWWMISWLTWKQWQAVYVFFLGGLPSPPAGCLAICGLQGHCWRPLESQQRSEHSRRAVGHVSHYWQGRVGISRESCEDFGEFGFSRNGENVLQYVAIALGRRAHSSTAHSKEEWCRKLLVLFTFGFSLLEKDYTRKKHQKHAYIL